MREWKLWKSRDNVLVLKLVDFITTKDESVAVVKLFLGHALIMVGNYSGGLKGDLSIRTAALANLIDTGRVSTRS